MSNGFVITVTLYRRRDHEKRTGRTSLLSLRVISPLQPPPFSHTYTRDEVVKFFSKNPFRFGVFGRWRRRVKIEPDQRV